MKDKSKVKETRINLRVTSSQLEQIKKTALAENKTITQYMIEKTLPPKKQ